jgi:hypothetical protein
MTDELFGVPVEPEPPVRKDELVKIRVYRGSTQAKGIINLAAKYKMHIIGGYARWMASPRANPYPADDIDLFASEEGRELDLLKALEKKKFEIHLETDNAYTFKKHEKAPYLRWPRIQVIKPFREGMTVTYGTLQEIISNFDFTVVRVGLINGTWALADPDFKKDEIGKRLKFKNIHCPISAVIRIAKYAKKGYFCSPMEIFRLFDDWDERGEQYKSELAELFLASETEEEFTEEQVMRLERLLRID